MLTKHQFLATLARWRNDAVVITTMGTVVPWARFSQTPLDFASCDSAMGHAADFALGIALAQPQRKVICLNGDGSMLMTLGTLVTIVQTGAKNLILCVIENSTYEVTGNQPIPGAGVVDFTGMAKAAGFPRTYTIDDVATCERLLPAILSGEGPVFVTVKVAPDEDAPPSRRPDAQAPYLRISLAESVRQLRRALGSDQ
ncbi:MAG: thiamine pyrophosphate-dependent enzyme [Abditibacteriales bacterium]|nr:thiamine pyrophosphate-dependent enzyme [Abditibacteriales bacterium]MDW8365577.1 thiamine pyrophosphate-dependent enzyme [Abditibacteriales bacterium]